MFPIEFVPFSRSDARFAICHRQSRVAAQEACEDVVRHWKSVLADFYAGEVAFRDRGFRRSSLCGYIPTAGAAFGLGRFVEATPCGPQCAVGAVGHVD